MNDELPSMPYPEHDSILGFKSPSYSAEQMREYAKKAVEAEREACAQIATQKLWAGEVVAKAIRARSKT